MPIELESRYNPKNIEKKWYDFWESSGVFKPETPAASAQEAKEPASKKSKSPGAKKSSSKKNAENYTIVIPPPNVTGQLHVGHALNHTIQDVLARYHRKLGQATLWLPGTDHAGIATQNRVEKNLREHGSSRLKVGREAFVKKVWEWKELSGGQITQQMRKLGNSVDWSRERFTMDENLSRAVAKVFVTLFNEDLIYRGERIINWCPSASCTTALANDEVIHKEREGSLWHIKYPLADGSGSIIVATTRPETMLGDTAVAIHPEDERYLGMHGKTVKLPLMNREIPIILDAAVDKEFGSGAVKITPAHDPNDFDMAVRHSLPFIRIMDDHAKINEHGASYRGLDRFEARKKVIEDLEASGLLEKIEKHKNAVGTCYRCEQVIEPILSMQWFVRTKPLAKKAIEFVQKDKIKFYPKRWENLYFDWMNNIQDWCISRQLWWGHRIPVFTCSACGHIFAAQTHPDRCEKCGESELAQDPDVLDTWFSSALWPFSTLGWPEETEDLKNYYPTSVLVTSFDIIFFWVARMIMMGIHFMKKEPFRHVYIHGLMRDEKGRKISKSLGNNIDPVDVIENYGADSYRFFLMATLSEGKDSVYSERRLKGYQNFTNKIWNSSRFALMNLPDGFTPDFDRLTEFSLEAEDFWILSRLNETIENMNSSFAEYKFHIATEEVYSFVWNNFCDWYLELIKPRIFGKVTEKSAESARQTLFYVLHSLIGLVHPFMPFLTEEIYSYLKSYRKPTSKKEENLITSPWPAGIKLDAKAKKTAAIVAGIFQVISSARTIRAEAGIAPDRKIKLIVRTSSKELTALLKSKEMAVQRLAQAESVVATAKYTPAEHDAMEAFSDGEVYLPLEGVLDLEKEIPKLKSEIQRLAGAIESGKKKLENPAFMDRAPEEVVAKERERVLEMEEKVEAMKTALRRYGANS